MRKQSFVPILAACSFCAVLAAPLARANDAVQPEGHDFSVVYQFTRHHGRSPQCGVLPLPDGALIGVTANGGAGKAGTIFRIGPDGTHTVVHSFGQSSEDGQYPVSCLLRASDGSIYGTTLSGGGFSGGIAFRIEPDGSAYRILHAFGASPDGPSTPSSTLVEATGGDFYGTTGDGGGGAGTIYRMTPAGDVTLIHALTAKGQQGRGPGTLVQAADGNLYGTTGAGGANGAGVFFRVRLDGAFKVLHDFDSVAEGAGPGGGIVEGKDGSFYGTLASGGPRGYGSAYRLKRDGALSVLHAFGDDPDKGLFPRGLVREPDGTFYGTTEFGGSQRRNSGFGTLFKMNAQGRLTTLHRFLIPPGGHYPGGGLALGPDGFLYGTCDSGGERGHHSRGTVFRIAPGKAD